MIFQHKDLTHCPERCQTCKNYDAIRHDFDGGYTFNATASAIGGTGNHSDGSHGQQQQQQIYHDEYGNPLSSMPWEMQSFYEYVHCARDFNKVQNIWKSGDSNKMYERVVRDFPQYSPRVLSRPEDSDYAGSEEDKDPSIGVGPWLIQLDDFLTDEDCDEMITQTKIAIHDTEGYSLVADSPDEYESSGACQSTQAWCDPNECMKQPVLGEAWSRIEELVGLPFHTHTEPVHFIQYVPGQKYGRHTDAIPEEYNSVAGPRIFTLLFYLNDIAEGNGGETCFPEIERKTGSGGNATDPICIRPKKGRALIWPNMLDELPEGTTEMPENRTYHEAKGIHEGFKFASTVWYHLRNFSYARDIDCTDIYTDRMDDYYYGFDPEGYFGGGNNNYYYYDDDDAYDDDNGSHNDYSSNNNYYHDGDGYTSSKGIYDKDFSDDDDDGLPISNYA